MNAGWIRTIVWSVFRLIRCIIYSLDHLCHSRMRNATDKVGDVTEKDSDKLNYPVCFAGKRIQRLWECKEIPQSCAHSHMCEDTSVVWERSFALETNLQVTSSQDTKPHTQLLLIKKLLFSVVFPAEWLTHRYRTEKRGVLKCLVRTLKALDSHQLNPMHSTLLSKALGYSITLWPMLKV